MKTKKPKFGWKKACIFNTCRVGYVIVKLQILGDCVLGGLNYFSGYATNKCRTSRAKVLKFSKKIPEGCRVVSEYSNSFVYKVGRIVTPTESFSNSPLACASGIHFFRTKKEAEAYNYK